MEIKKVLGISEESLIGTVASSIYLGSPTFDEIPFHVRSGCLPALNSYVVDERDSDVILHYGRITSGTEDNPRADPSVLQKNAAYQVGQKDPRPGDKSPHVTRVLKVEVLGEIRLEDDSPTIKEPALLAQTGKGVYELPASLIPWLLNIPDDPDKGLHIGTVQSGKDAVEIILPFETIPRQTLVCGKTGTGKSYFAGVLVEEVVRQGIPAVSFDVLGDLTRATEDLGGRNFRAGMNFRVPYATIGLSEFLGFIPNLTREQSELVSIAYETVSGEALDTLNKEGRVTMPLERLLDEIVAVGASCGQAPVAGRAIQRVRAAVMRNSLLTTRTEEWLVELTEKPMINVFIGHLGQNGRSLVVGASARMLQTLRRRDRVPPFALVLDEAHLLLPSGEHTPSTSVLREMIRTARHDSIGVILITQSPSSMDKNTVLTCNTRVVFALDREDLRLISGALNDLPEEAIARIAKLPKGSAVVSSSPEIMRHSVLVRVRKRRTREGAPTPDMREEVKKWRRQKQTKA